MSERLRLRYKVVCSIGELEEAPGATGPMGYTDDLEVAIWYADHSPYPGWVVHDVIENKYVGGGEPPQVALERMAIERLLLRLTERWFQVYPYPKPHDEISARIRDLKTREHERLFPDWRPASEFIVAPIRQAYYNACVMERAYAESEPPGQLAIQPDGRDLVAR